MTADIKDFYLATPLNRPEYMRISVKHIPLNIQKRYDMEQYIVNRYVVREINNAVYGLPQTGKLSQDQLVTYIEKHDYIWCPNNPCLLKHKSNGVAFYLVVNDFLIKYHKQADADHLLAALREKYFITTNTAKTIKCVGITIKYSKVKNIITLSMPDYITKTLKTFGNEHVKGDDLPLIYVPPHYGAKTQLAVIEDDSAPPKKSKRCKKLCA